MATTTAKKKPVKKAEKSSKKAPTKTSVKSAVKPVKSDSKVISKKVSSKASTKETKSVSDGGRRTATPFERLRALHFSNFFIGAVLAIIVGVMLTPFTKDILLDYQARDVFVTSETVNLGPATEVLFNLDLKYLLIAVLGVGSIVSLLIATRLYKRYEASVKLGISGTRWILFSIASVFVFEFVALLAGVQDIMTLKVVSALVIVAGILAWVTERESLGAKRLVKLPFYGTIFAYILALTPIATSLVATTLLSAERFSWYVYVISIVLGLSVLAIIMNLRASIVNNKSLEYVVYEQRFIRIDQITKLLIVLVIISVFNK